MDYRIGIDPGVSGSIVVLAEWGKGDFLPEAWLRMPFVKMGKSPRVNCPAVAAFLRRYAGCHAYIESVHAMPGQGSVSMFTFGHAAGAVEGVVGALGMPMTLVTPQRWKKHAGLIGTDKDASRSRAIQVWPDWTVLSKKGAGQAFADAAFIATYGDAS